jgi:amidase
MAVESPSAERIRSVAAALGLRLGPDDAESYRELMAVNLEALAVVDSLPDASPAPGPARSAGERPVDADNPLGAWYVRTRIEGTPGGPLSGRSVVLKDNVMLAGVPMMNGTSILEGYVPPVDASIVTRILDAGGVIVGKAVCEAYCFSGGSHTSATGPVRNPHDPSRSAGGSSSGSAALMAAGEVDLAVGCDQGGSVRVLVPYTGILGFDPSIDHAGPMTASVRDNAQLLEVIAGPDGLDERQCEPRVARYTEALGPGVQELRIGVLTEGFGHDGSQPEVDRVVRAAADRFARLGAGVEEVSVPLHRVGPALGFARVQASLACVFESEGVVLGFQQPVHPSYVRFQHRWRERPEELPENLKLLLIFAEYLRQERGYEYVARAEQHMRGLRAAYDEALRRVDLLLMPTTPTTATLLPGPAAPREEVLQAAFGPITNTMPFDHTHHPAMSLPCGRVEGLPVGMMLVGRHWEESTIYRAAHAFEQHEDWRAL